MSEDIAVADDDEDDDRNAHQGRDGVDRQGEALGDEVADQKQGRAREHRPRHQDAVVGRGEKHACEVRHGQPDETHRAAEGGDGAREQDRGEEDQRARALHVESHRAGIVLAQQQQVERLDGGDAEHEPRGDDGEHQGEVAARDVAQRPHRPDDERFERRLARQVLEYLDYGTDARAEHHAQDEDDHDVLDAAADRHHNQQHECRAEPCRAGDAQRLYERVRRDAQQRGSEQEQRYTQPGARADAQHIGPGQRVAEKGLHLQAAGGERRAGQECRDGFEQPYPQDDVPDGGVAVAARERRPDVGGCHGDRADQEVGREERHGQQRKCREEECGSAGGHLAVLEFEGGFVTYVDGDAVGRAGRPPGGFLQGLDGLFPADVVVGAEDLDVAQFALLVDREGDPHGAGGGTLVFAALVADIPEEPRVEPRGVFSLEERIDDLHVEFIPLCVDRMAFDRTKVPEVDGQQVANFDRLAVDQAGRPGRGFHDYAADFAQRPGIAGRDAFAAGDAPVPADGDHGVDDLAAELGVLVVRHEGQAAAHPADEIFEVLVVELGDFHPCAEAVAQGVDGEDFIALPHHGDAVVERIGLGIPAGDDLGAVAVGEAVERTLLDDSVAVREVAEPRFRARGRRLQPEQGREEYCEPLHYSSRL